MSIDFSLTVTAGNFSLEANAILPSNTVTAVVGPSGSGKTTLLRTLAGLETNASGNIRCNGDTWLHSTKLTFVPPEERRIGYVFQNGTLFSHLSVSQNIEYAQKRATPGNKRSFDDIVDLCQIRSLLKQKVSTLSGGETQRVAIARALASNPQLLLCDEPLSALDGHAKRQLSHQLQSILRASKIPAIYVTHNLTEAAQLSSHLLVLRRGSVAASGPTSEILPRLFHDAPDDPFSTLNVLSLDSDSEPGLLKIETPIGRFLLPSNNTPQSLDKLLIWARDVGICKRPIPDSSFLNQLPVTISSIQEIDSGRVLLTLEKDDHSFLSLITKKSFDSLELAPNQSVTALIKTSAFLPRSEP